MIRLLKPILPFIILLLLTSCAYYKTHYEDFTPTPHGSLRITSYNINWQGGAWRVKNPDENIEALRYTQSDIAILQETTDYWEKRLKKALKKDFPHQVYRHHESSGGLGVLSKYPIQTVKQILSPYGWFPALLVTVKTPKGIIQLLSVHLIPALDPYNNVGFLGLPTLLNPLTRKRDIQYFREQLDPNLPTLIAGDFNEGDKGPAVEYLRKEGFQDALDYLPETAITWAWPTGPMTFTARFDRLFYSSQFTLNQVQVLHEGTSDHFPVVVDFGVKTWKLY